MFAADSITGNCNIRLCFEPERIRSIGEATVHVEEEGGVDSAVEDQFKSVASSNDW